MKRLFFLIISISSCGDIEVENAGEEKATTVDSIFLSCDSINLKDKNFDPNIVAAWGCRLTEEEGQGALISIEVDLYDFLSSNGIFFQMQKVIISSLILMIPI